MPVVQLGKTAATLLCCSAPAMPIPSDKLIVPVPLSLQQCPPSVIDGTLTLEEELEQRLFGCAWIQKASILLGVRTEAMSNGQVIFHRFYYRRSMREFDVKVRLTLLKGKTVCFETQNRVLFVKRFSLWLRLHYISAVS